MTVARGGLVGIGLGILYRYRGLTQYYVIRIYPNVSVDQRFCNVDSVFLVYEICTRTVNVGYASYFGQSKLIKDCLIKKMGFCFSGTWRKILRDLLSYLVSLKFKQMEKFGRKSCISFVDWTSKAIFIDRVLISEHTFKFN